MDKFTIVRLLHAVALNADIEATPGNIIGEFKKVDKNFSASTIDSSALSKWLHAKALPRDGNLDILIKLFNNIFFNGENKISSDDTWDKLGLNNELKIKSENYVDRYVSIKLRNSNPLIAPDYLNINPSDLSTQLRIINNDELLKAHLLYHSPRSPEIWEAIKASPHYPLYNCCQDGVRALLKKPKWKQLLPEIGSVFNLGAGSSSKDRLILDSLNNDDILRPYIWVDASMYMLLKTFKDANPTKYSNVRSLALLADFEHPTRMMSLLSDSFPEISKFKNKKAFFILGFSLSNISEERFFNTYKSICAPGDLFIFPMQFIPEETIENKEVLEQFIEDLKDSYDFPEGKELAEEWIKLADDQFAAITPLPPTVNQNVHFHRFTRSINITFRASISQSGHEKTIVTAMSSRHYKSDFMELLKDQGFKLIDETAPKDGVTTLLVEFAGQH